MNTLRIINPANENIITELSKDTEEQIHKKFLHAQKAFSLFQKTSFQERAAIIQKFSELLQKKKNQLAKVLTEEMGKPIRQSLGEIEAIAVRITFFLEHTEKEMNGEVMHQGVNGVEEKITRGPLGVIANISAWNYPYFVGINVIVPALLCGNCVLYKPSEYTTLTGIEIEKLLTEAGLPNHVFQTILGSATAAQFLLQQNVAGIYFTGSYKTGKKILSCTYDKMVRTQLELGGKDPAYVHFDVSLEHAVPSLASGVFYNNGQSCCAVERLYIHEKIYNSFVDKFTAIVKTFVIGDPQKEDTFFGPLARKEQVAYLEEQLEDALKKGAVSHLKGASREEEGMGYYFSPTILTDTNHQMLVMKEETFGPLIGLQKVQDEQEALELMKDTEYGLTAAVYTRQRNLAEKMLADIPSGSAYWNVCDRVSPYLPWSGKKHSGMGSTLSIEGIHSFLQTKAWHCHAV